MMLPGESDGPIPWRQLFLGLARRYGWTPQQIGRLTLAQAATYSGEPADGQKVRLEPNEALAVCNRRQRDREAWIERELKAEG
jgi:hypothetical protein